MYPFAKYLLLLTCLTGSSLSGVLSEVAHCTLDTQFPPNSNFGHVVGQLETLDKGELNKALFELSPVNFGNVEWMNARNNSYVAELLSQHLFQLCCAPFDCFFCNCCSCLHNTTFWIHAFGNLMDNTQRFDHLAHFAGNAGGVLVGMDGCWGPEFVFGASFGYTHTGFHWEDRGHGDSNSYYGSLYGSWDSDCLILDYSAIGGATSYSLERRIDFATIDRSARSDPWGYFLTLHLGIRSEWEFCCTQFEPYALVDYHFFHRSHFREHEAESINLVVDSKNQNILRGEAGLRIYWSWVTFCYCIGPYIGLSWVGEFPLNESKQKAHFVDQSCDMDVTSYHSSVQLVSPQAGFKWTYTDGYSFILGYKGLFNSKTRINQVEGRLEWMY